MLKTIQNGVPYKSTITGYCMLVSWTLKPKVETDIERNEFFNVILTETSKQIKSSVGLVFYPYTETSFSWSSLNKYGNLVKGYKSITAEVLDAESNVVELFVNEFKVEVDKFYTLDFQFSDSLVTLKKNLLNLRIFLKPETSDKKYLYALPDLKEAELDTLKVDVCTTTITKNACLLDPLTKTSLGDCLIWRRTDDLGVECGKTLNDEQKIKSALLFCNTNPKSVDCLCINRKSTKEYADLVRTEPYKTSNPYCWFSYCKNGNYLRDFVGDFKCVDNDCVSKYVTTENGVISTAYCSVNKSSTRRPAVANQGQSTTDTPAKTGGPLPTKTGGPLPTKTGEKPMVTQRNIQVKKGNIFDWFDKYGIIVALLLVCIILYRS